MEVDLLGSPKGRKIVLSFREVYGLDLESCQIYIKRGNSSPTKVECFVNQQTPKPGRTGLWRFIRSIRQLPVSAKLSDTFLFAR